jgi:putative ABC transport system substrate-binding protein
MRRTGQARAVGLGLVLAGAVWSGVPSGLHAQPTKVARVAVLGAGIPSSTEVAAFREGLKELGWVEGQNLEVEARFAEWKYDRLPGLATELVRWRPDVLFTHTTPAVLAARQATRTVPIVVGAVGDLVEKGIVASLARPGGNITGLTLITDELEAKLLELLKEAVPALRQVAVLTNPGQPRYPAVDRRRGEAARALGLQLVLAEARGSAELDPAFAAMARGHAEALLVTNDGALGDSRKAIADLAVKHRLPAVAENPLFAEVGGLLAYGPRYDLMFRRAAGFADKILRGARPGDLPIERPDTFTLVVNLRTAKTLGVAVPPAILARADRAVQ